MDSWSSPQPMAVSENNDLEGSPYSPAQLLDQYIGSAEQANAPTVAYYNYLPNKIYSFVENIAAGLNSTTTEPQLTIQNGVVTNFVPPKNGVFVDSYQTSINILKALSQNATSAEISAATVLPKTQLSQLNNLGINELIAEGVSSDKGSPNNRNWNIGIGVKKMTGIIIPQGAEFSFDNALGPVTSAQGYLPELVILSNQTVPEDGGGLCQVSTTMFRAAMAAGLPITERINHAYAVSYYSPQGTDATIYPGSADLKFINDTPGAILVWPYIENRTTVIFDFYGTNDGRQVVLHPPVVYDRQADGSMKATWQRDVIKDGVTTTKIFNSNYLPPALFHETSSTNLTPATSTTPGLQMPKT